MIVEQPHVTSFAVRSPRDAALGPPRLDYQPPLPLTRTRPTRPLPTPPHPARRSSDVDGHLEPVHMVRFDWACAQGRCHATARSPPLGASRATCEIKLKRTKRLDDAVRCRDPAVDFVDASVKRYEEMRITPVQRSLDSETVRARQNMDPTVEGEMLRALRQDNTIEGPAAVELIAAAARTPTYGTSPSEGQLVDVYA